MLWRIYVTCLVLGFCLTQSVRSSIATHNGKNVAKTSDDFFIDDEELAVADEASGSGPVSAPTFDEDEGDDVIEEDEVSQVDNKPVEVQPATTSTPAPPVTPKVSAVASKPVAPPPSADDTETGSGSGAGPDIDGEDDYEDPFDESSVTGENEEDDIEVDNETDEEVSVGRANPVDTRIVPQVSTTPPAPPSVEPPREENQIPVVTSPPTNGPPPPPTDTNESGNGGAHVFGHKPEDRPVSFFAQPGILAAVVGGAVVGLLCAILLVMFIVYRMRKKDEGSYALDEPKRSPNSYAYNKNSREFFA